VHFVPVLVWSVIMFLLFGIPGKSMPELDVWAYFPFDKFAHITVFAIFTFLLAIALKKQYGNGKIRYHGVKIALLCGVSYAVIMEVMQQIFFSGRNFDVYDIVANITGSVIGILIFMYIYKGIVSLS
jgi:VanZ family protein